MLYEANIVGVSPIIMRNGASVYSVTPASREKEEITAKRGRNRTESDKARLAELECQLSLWLTVDGRPTIPATAIQANLDEAARKLRQGQQVREGLVVTETHFDYDLDRYGTTIEELGQKTQFTTGVVVKGVRTPRTRAKFELPWSCSFTVDADDEQVDKEQLTNWLHIGGQRLGIGDWRPAKRGPYGRFRLESLDTAEH